MNICFQLTKYPGRVRAQGRVDRGGQLPRPQGGGGPLRRPPQGRQLPASEGREEELGGNDCFWCGGEGLWLLLLFAT